MGAFLRIVTLSSLVGALPGCSRCARDQEVPADSRSTAMDGTKSAVPAAQAPELPAGVKAEDLKTGTGQAAAPGMLLLVHYTVKVAGSEKVLIDSRSQNQPKRFTLGMGEVLRGWDIGLPGLQAGGTRRLTLSPDFAYGPAPVGSLIPPNSTIIFEIELLETSDPAAVTEQEKTVTPPASDSGRAP